MMQEVNKRRVSITVIDSGVDTAISDLSLFVNETISMRRNEHGFIDINEDSAVHHIHGTVVSLVIRDLCPDVRIRSINILDKNLTGDGRILLAAMEYALREPPEILHLSLGTTRRWYWFSFRSLLNKAQRAGTIIVAAADNSGQRSYPAFLKGVAGVKTDPKLSEKMDFYYRSGFYFAPCEIDRIHGNNEIKTRIGGNSTAAAFISGHIANFLSNKGSSPDVADTVKSIKSQGINNFKSTKECLS